MISLDASTLINANVHHVFYQIFKQLTNHIVLVLIQILMHLNTSRGRPIWCQTPDLLIGIFGYLIENDPINLMINGIFPLLEHFTDTWGQSTVLVPVFFITVVFIAGISVKTDDKS